ncbi:MAG: hypothetical protein OEZ38_04525 [Gammaproteobacteria bacterium]|nr:hypothetical protein [Gammaproteobacteria bacterium]
MADLAILKFDAGLFRKRLEESTADLVLSLKADKNTQSENALQMLVALTTNIDIMQRLDADLATTGSDVIEADEISQIADYALSLISELAVLAAQRGLQQVMADLIQLSMPVAGWVSEHRAKIFQLDVVVNAVASYANTLQEPADIEQLCNYISQIMPSIVDEVSNDLENANPMRPWRILNLNWGIVATRSHNIELIEKVYTALMQNIPDDAHGFITEAMEQMDIIGYPDSVRQVVEKFYNSLGYNQQRH